MLTLYIKINPTQGSSQILFRVQVKKKSIILFEWVHHNTSLQVTMYG